MKREKITREIVKHIGIISASPKRWPLALNMVSWNRQEAKFDLRDWSPEHTRSGRGNTLTIEEARTLYALLRKDMPYYFVKSSDAQRKKANRDTIFRTNLNISGFRACGINESADNP